MIDINEIVRLLPHTYPFLLVDRIVEFVHAKKIVGIKNVTYNEPFFQGHFPGRPIMPGVLIVEAMAQTGGVAIVNLLDSHHIGRIGHYAEVAAEAGLISFFWVNVAGRPPIVAPYAAKEARFGTNPHAIGIPVPGGDPLILDFATSRMAHGKARVALNKGEIGRAHV